MKFETRPEEVEAIQWSGDPDTLPVLLGWIMEDRVGEQYEGTPAVTYTRHWGPPFDGTGQPKARLEGHRWSVSLEAGDWVVKNGPHVFGCSDELFKERYKQKRSTKR